MASSDTAAAAIRPRRGIIRGMVGARGASWLSAVTCRDGRALGWPWLALVFALPLGACGAPEAPARGFGSEQLLAVRDPLLSLRTFTEDESRLYVGRFVQMPAQFGLEPPYDLSTVDLTSGALSPVAPAVVSMTTLAGEPGRGRTAALVGYPSAADVPPDYLAISGALPGRLVVSLVDELTGERLEIPDVSGRTRGRVTFGARVTDPMSIERLDVRGEPRLWFGAPAQLREAPIEVLSILGFDGAGALVMIGPTLSGQTSIQRLPFDGTPASIVVPTLGADQIVIADEAGTTTAIPPGLSGPLFARYRCAGGTGGAEPSACLLVYARTDRLGGAARLFARPAEGQRESALPGALTYPDWVSAGSDFVAWTTLTATGGHLHTWNNGAEQVGGCEAPSGAILQLVRSATSSRFAAGIAEINADGVVVWSTGRWVLGTPGGGCRVAPNTFETPVRAFSPDERSYLWLESGISRSVVHLTDVDSGADRAIALTGAIVDARYLDARRLLLFRSSGDGTGVSWIDIEGESVVEDHIIGDAVSTWRWLNTRWLLLGDARSAQDDTFVLRLVNIDTGASRVISRSVGEFSIPWTTPPPGAVSLPVAYLVRGRGPSAQDGIWLAHVPLAELAP